MVLHGAERKFVVIVQSLYSLIFKPWGKAHCLITEKSYQFVCILTEVHALRFHHSLEGINVSAVHISLLYFQKKIVFERGRWYLTVYCVCQIFLECIFSASVVLFPQHLTQ